MNKEWEMLVTENMGLVYMVARRYVSASHEMEDLVSLGKIGLVKAAKKYDETREIKFSTYAVYYIQGEIASFLRDDGLIKVSRGLKKNREILNRFTQQFEKEYGRAPSLGELANVANMTTEDVASALSVQGVTDLDEAYMAEDTKSRQEQERVLDEVCAGQLLEGLEERERTLIVCRFYKQLSQVQTAKVMEMSQSKVSRMEEQILGKMRGML